MAAFGVDRAQGVLTQWSVMKSLLLMSQDTLDNGTKDVKTAIHVAGKRPVWKASGWHNGPSGPCIMNTTTFYVSVQLVACPVLAKHIQINPEHSERGVG